MEESKRLLLDKAFAYYSIPAIVGKAGLTFKIDFNKILWDVVGILSSEYVKHQQSV